MARFNAQEALEQKNQPKKVYKRVKYAPLSDHMAVVRGYLMYDNIGEIEGYSFHEVTRVAKSGKQYKQRINCTGANDGCVLCKANVKRSSSLFLQIYNVDAQEVQLFPRPLSFMADIVSASNRYTPKGGKLKDVLIDIERKGAKGTKPISYTIYDVRDGDKPPIPADVEMYEVIGDIIQQPDEQSMGYILNNLDPNDLRTNNQVTQQPNTANAVANQEKSTGMPF